MIRSVFGVDFSGAKLAGLNIWIARTRVVPGHPRLVLESLDRLGQLAGTNLREPALAHLVHLILGSHQALWGMDFPFALPIEIAGRDGFRTQLQWVCDYPENAYEFGRDCVKIARKISDKLHLRRITDTETKTPFDCYHYRIVCQTFHGMRDVLGHLVGSPGTVIWPFELSSSYERLIVETCPGSTLKRWKVPHHNYKQPAGGPLEPKRLRNRRIILERLRQTVELSEAQVRKIQRNPGGDALDAVIAAVGTWESFQIHPPETWQNHPRYRLEGKIFA